MKTFARVFLGWLPLAVAITGVCGLVYVTVQQNYRQSLNDPQIQMTEDAAAKLAAGVKPNEVVSNPEAVDIVSSLAPWLAIYNNDGVSLVSSGTFNGAIPEPPKGAFLAARNNEGNDTNQPNENRITWQSGAGVRQAIVIVPFENASSTGFVVAGRNMREVENRESALTVMVELAWTVTLIASFLATLVVDLVQE